MKNRLPEKKHLQYRQGKNILLPLIIILQILLSSQRAWAAHTYIVVPVSGLMARAQLSVLLPDCGTYQWNWGDDALSGTFTILSSGTTNYYHTYTEPGTYSVSLLCGGVPDSSYNVTVPAADTTDPTINITGPTTLSSYTTSVSSVTLSGIASDNIAVTQVTWTNNRGGSGAATGTTAWNIAGITLQSGSNIITVTAHDSAGNTGTDQITVTYTPPAAASATFTIAVSPAASSVVQNQKNPVTAVWSANAAAGGTFNVSSSQGQFITQNGSVLATIYTARTISIMNGSGSVSESVNLPASAVAAALKSGQNRIYYKRNFTRGTANASASMILQIVPASAGPFSLVRMEMKFSSPQGPGNSAGRITVPAGTRRIETEAYITYNGGGLLRAQWKVDGQILGYVTRYLYPGARQAIIKSPQVPGFPTYDTGKHKVELEILSPAPAFDEPVIYYFVSTENTGSVQPVKLLAPADRSSVAVSAGPGDTTRFKWQLLPGRLTYLLEILPAGYSPGTQPITSARTTSDSYTVSQAAAGVLKKGMPYIWHIRAFKDGVLTGKSPDRIFYPAPAGSISGKVRFQGLRVVEKQPDQGLTIQTSVKNENSEEKNNFKIEFKIDGQTVDAAFITSLAPGETKQLEGIYQNFDNKNHSLEVRAVKGQGKSAVIMAQITGTITGKQEAQSAKNKNSPNELHIGEFILEPAEIQDNSIDSFTGNGIIHFPYANAQIPVNFENLHLNSGRTRVTQGTIIADIAPHLELELGPGLISITRITFKPDNAGCNGVFRLNFPFSSLNDDNQQLALELTGIIVHPEDGLSGVLTLAQDFSPDLVFLEGFTLVIAHGSTITLKKNGIESSFLGKIHLPSTILIPNSGKGGKSTINFSGLAIQEDGGLYGNAVLDASNIAGTNFGLQGSVILDLTQSQSPGGLNSDWTGIYIDNCSLDMPSALNIPAVEINAIYMDNGLNGHFTADINKNFQIGQAENAFKGLIKNIDINFQNYSAAQGTITGFLDGTMTIPLVNMEVNTHLGISVNGVSARMSLANDMTGITLVDGIKLDIGKESTIGFENGIVTAELKTGITALGNLGPNLQGTISATLVITSNGDFKLKDPNGNLDVWMECGNHSVDFYNMFTLNLDRIGFGIEKDRGLIFGIGGGFSICDKFEASVKKMGVSIPDGDPWTEDIKVAYEQPDSFRFDGTVSFYNSDTNKGFRGAMELVVINSLRVDSTLMVGKKTQGSSGFYYFYIDGSLDLPPPGITLTPYPIAFYGFGGGAYYNMAPSISNDGRQRTYTPSEGSFGLIAKTTIGTSFDEGETFHARPTLEINIRTQDNAGFEISLGGPAYILCKPTDEKPYRKIEASLSLGCGEDNGCAFSARMQVNDFAVVDPENLILAISSELDMKLSQDEWYLRMGTKQDPSSVRVLPTKEHEQLLTGKSYLEVDKLGIRGGAMVEVDKGGTLLIFYGRVWGGFAGDFEISFDPGFVYAEFSVWMGLEAGLDLGNLGQFEIFSAEAMLNGGVRTPDPTRIWVHGEMHYAVLGGLVSGSWAMTITWGDPIPSSIDQADTWPIFDSADPEDGTNNVDVTSSIRVNLTTPASGAICGNNGIQYQDEQGNFYDVSAFLDNFSVHATSVQSLNPNVGRVPGQITWNSSCTSFTFEPDGFLYPHETYEIKFQAHAQGTMITSGRYDEEKIFRFTTGEFPSNLKRMVKESYPMNSQEFCYTGYPVFIRFTRALPILSTSNVTGKLFKNGTEEVAGAFTVAQDFRSASFLPSHNLEPNTFYEFKLIRQTTQNTEMHQHGTQGTIAGSGSSANMHPAAETGMTAQTGGIQVAHTIPHTLATLEQFTAALGSEWLNIKFKTGSFATLKEMLQASHINARALRYRMCSSDELAAYLNRPVYNVKFETIEPVYWQQVNIKTEPLHQPVMDSGHCRMNFIYPQSGLQPDINTACRTETGWRNIQRSAYEQFIQKQVGPRSGPQQNHRFELMVNWGPFSILPLENDCPEDIQQWENQLNTGERAIGDECIHSLNTRLVQGTRITLSHKFFPVAPSARFAMELDLPDLPSAWTPCGGAYPGGNPQDLPTHGDAIQVNGAIYHTHEMPRPVFHADLFQHMENASGKISKSDPALQDFQNEIKRYQDQVDQYNLLNQSSDLNREYNDLNRQYKSLAEHFEKLDPMTSGRTIESFMDLVTELKSLNNRYQSLNRGENLF